MNPPAARSYRWLFWTMALIGLTVDQTSKYGMFAHLYNGGRGGRIVLIDNLFSLDANYQMDESFQPLVWETDTDLLYTLRAVSGEAIPEVNPGALWGQKLVFEDTSANLVFAVISLIAALAIIVWSTLAKSARDGLLCFALGLILAGAVGNLYDRLVFRGVRDFLHFHPFRFPIFNVADCCLVCGAGLLLFQAFFLQPAEEPQPPASAKQQEAPTPAAEPVTSE